MDEARWDRMERTMEFLLKQQADTEARTGAAEDRFNNHIEEILRVQSGLQVLVEASFARHDATDWKLQRLTESVQELRDAQLHTEGRLNALIGFVDNKLGGSPLN